MRRNSMQCATAQAISTVVVDLDGPLLDGRERHYRCYSDILEEHGITPLAQRVYWQRKRERTDRREMLAMSGADGLYDTFLASWMERIEQRRYLALDRLQEGVVDILARWRSRGVFLVLATMRNNPRNLQWQLRQVGLHDLFDRIIVVGSGAAGRNKGAEVREKVPELDPKNALWIGDTEVDVRAAHELGMPICVLGCGLRTPEYLMTLNPDYLDDDLSSFDRKGGRLIAISASSTGTSLHNEAD